MAIQAGFDLLKNAFLGWTPFNITWAFSIIAVVLTMAILTRDFNKWKQLFLPVMISWHIAGITPHFLMYIIGTLLFILEHISIEQLGQLAEVTTRTAKTAINKMAWEPRQRQWKREREYAYGLEEKAFKQSKKTIEELEKEKTKNELKIMREDEERRRLLEKRQKRAGISIRQMREEDLAENILNGQER